MAFMHLTQIKSSHIIFDLVLSLVGFKVGCFRKSVWPLSVKTSTEIKKYSKTKLSDVLSDQNKAIL